MRSTRLVSLAAAMAAALGASGAWAQSLLSLYEAARAQDAAWQSARAQYEANLARADQSRAGILPTANLSSSYSRTQAEIAGVPVQPGLSNPNYFGTQNTTLSASQPLYRPGNWASFQQGKRQGELARAQLMVAEQDLVIRVSQAYFDVLAAQDTLAFVRAQQTAVGEQLASAKRNFEVGTSTITDSREAQARYDLVLAQEIAADNDLRIRKLALDTLVGRPNADPVPVAVPLELGPPEPADVEAWVSQAEQASPAVQQARLNLDVARLETEKARAGHKPTLDLQASYAVIRNINGTSTNPLLPTTTRPTIAQAGVVLNVPLFAGFATQNRVRETLSLEDKASADLDNARRTVTQNTRAAYYGLVSGQGQVRALEAAEASSQSALDANRLGYQVGVRINIDVLNAQSQLFQTKRDLAQARYNVLLGQLKLRQANGTLVPEDLARLNTLLAR
ncbi:MAG: TolC family outer membrane protein [Ramlibacter sp.]